MNQIISASNFSVISPLIVLAIGAIGLLLLEVLLRRSWRREIIGATTIVIAIALFTSYRDLFQPQLILFSGHFFADPLTFYFSLLVLISGLATIILANNSLGAEGVESSGEFYALLLFGIFGAIVFVSAANFITLFLGLEIMSMALYSLCASALASRRSSESALKYFLLGSFSSAFLLYGIALLYGLTGSLEIVEIASRIASVDSYLPMIAFAMIAVGLLFKVGAIPFHFWMPDVYQGAPTPVTAFMATAVKAAAFAVTLRIINGVFADLSGLWAGMIACAAMLTMVGGNLLALQQRSMKRMLAFSSIAHAGYLLVGILALGGQYGGAAAIAFYLVVYGLMTFGSFVVVQLVSATRPLKKNSDDISHFQGLGKSNPFLAACLTLFLFALAGLPPGVSGLVGKFFLFSAAIRADYVLLSVVGVLASAVSCYYYLRVIVAMYFIESTGSDEPEMSGAIVASLPVCALLVVSAVLVIMLGIFPSQLYDAAQIATQRLL